MKTIKRIAPVWVATAKDRPLSSFIDTLEGDFCAKGVGVAYLTIVCRAGALGSRCRTVKHRYYRKRRMGRKIILRFDKLSTALNGSAYDNLSLSEQWTLPLRELKPAADQSWHDAPWFQEWIQLARRDYHGRES